MLTELTRPPGKRLQELVTVDRDLAGEGAGGDPRGEDDPGRGPEPHAPPQVGRATRTVWSSYCATPRVNDSTAAKIRSFRTFGGRARPASRRLGQTLHPELLVLRVGRFGDAVGVEDDEVAGREHDAALDLVRRLEHPDRDAAARQERHARLREPDSRVVPGVHVPEAPVGGVEDGHEQGDELAGRREAGEVVVHAGDEPRQVRRPRFHEEVDAGVDGRDEERGRNSLARDVGDAEGDAPVGERVDVVEVAADLAGRDGSPRRGGSRSRPGSVVGRIARWIEAAISISRSIFSFSTASRWSRAFSSAIAAWLPKSERMRASAGPKSSMPARAVLLVGDDEEAERAAVRRDRDGEELLGGRAPRAPAGGPPGGCR